MARKLDGRVALVTGGAHGIGRAICAAFAQEGARVAVADIDIDAAQNTSSSLPRDSGMALEMDVASGNSVRAAVDAAINRLGSLDILVNNAGLLYHTTLENCTEEDWERMIGVNLKGPFLCAQAVSPHMIARRSGCIINLTSLAAKMGGLGTSPPYAAAKGGTLTLTVYLARALAPHRVRVNGIAPGIIDTRMTRDLGGTQDAVADQIPLGGWGHPDDVARCAVFLASDDARYITGEIVDVNGGLLMD